MARGEIYTIYRKKNGDDPNRVDYICQKLDRRWEPGSFYTLTRLEYSCMEGIRVQVTCDCFAGTRETCRHRLMLDMFLKYDLVDSGQCYDYDRQKWWNPQPANLEE